MQSTRLESLATLARSSCSRETWRACLHYAWARLDAMYFDFGTSWLYGMYEDGTYRFCSADVEPYVRQFLKDRSAGTLSEYGIKRGARDLLRMATDFGILSGKVRREFASYHLPEVSFLYLLHDMAESEPNARRIVDSPVWHLFLMSSNDVERELLRLHQFRKVHYEVAGSLAQLKLPHGSSTDYARELCA